MQNSSYRSERIARSGSIILAGPVQDIFLLFGPIGEMKWAPGWKPVVRYSESGDIEEHMVFQTRPDMDQDEPVFTWTVSRYQPDRFFVEYTIFTSERLWTIGVRCEESSHPKETRAEVTYTYTALSEKGAERNDRDLNSHFAHGLKDWEEAVNHYLATGAILAPGKESLRPASPL